MADKPTPFDPTADASSRPSGADASSQPNGPTEHSPGLRPPGRWPGCEGHKWQRALEGDTAGSSDGQCGTSSEDSHSADSGRPQIERLTQSAVNPLKGLRGEGGRARSALELVRRSQPTRDPDRWPGAASGAVRISRSGRKIRLV